LATFDVPFDQRGQKDALLHLGVVKDHLQGAVAALWRSPERQVDGEVELRRTGHEHVVSTQLRQL